MERAWTITYIIFLHFGNILFGQNNIADSIFHQGVYRDYVIHLPPSYNGTQELPMVIVLHGGSGTGISTIGFTQFDLVADTANFIALFPQGEAIANNGFVWADGRGTSADKMGLDDVDFIDKLLDSLKLDYAIDLNRVYATGFSNGGFMSQRLACDLSDRLAAVATGGATIGNEVWANCQPSNPMPVMIVHGTADPFVPFNGGRVSATTDSIASTDSLIQFWVNHNNCQLQLDSMPFPDIDMSEGSTVTRFPFSACDCQAAVELFKVYNGGHTWPGVELVSYELIAGETNEDIHAAVEMWNFFNKHSLDCSIVSAPEQIKQDEIRIFPNPGKEQINFKGIAPPFLLSVQTIEGKMALQKIISDNGAIEVSSLDPGMYVIQLIKEEEKAVLKWVKQ